MGEYFCDACKIPMNSQSQWNQHVTGGKHLRAVALLSNTSAADETQSEGNPPRAPSPDMSSAILDQDGKYKCKDCEDFVCDGIVPMKQHLIGQKHFKSLQRSKNPITVCMTSPSKAPLFIATSPLTNKPTGDLSLAIQLPDGKFQCKVCEDICSGLVPIQQHLIGQKHMKNVQRSAIQSSPSSTPSPVLSPSAVGNPSPSPPPPAASTADMSCALLQPDGSYKCSVCEDFSCTGRIPMSQHLAGKSHHKTLQRQNAAISSPASTITSSPMRCSIILSPEERVERSWKHPIVCKYSYDDSFATLSAQEKIQVLSPHFAFVGKDESIPDLLKYLSI